MIRTGYVVHSLTLNIRLNEEEWIPLPCVYMSKREAEDAADKYAKETNNDMVQVFEVNVIENDETVDDLLNQLEKEDVYYQATLSAALEEVIEDINNPVSIEENDYQNSDGSIKSDKIKDWLENLTTSESKEHAVRKTNEAINWLETISICGGD